MVLRINRKTLEPGYQQLLDQYEKYLVTKRLLASASCRTQRAIINGFFHQIQGGDLPLRTSTVLELDASAFNQWVQGYAERVAPRTIKNFWQVIHGLYEFLHSQGLVDTIPVVRPGEFLAPPGPPARLTPEEVELVFTLLPPHKHAWVEARDRAILHLYYDAELFPAQVHSLKNGSFDGNGIKLWNSGDRSYRYYELPSIVRDAIKRYTSLLPVATVPDEMLFRSYPQARRLTDDSHWRYLHKKSKELGIRYTATLLRMAGVHTRLNQRPRSGATAVPTTWGHEVHSDVDYDELAAQFKATHPRW